MFAPSPTVTVFAPGAHITITVEEATSSGDEIHLHAAGQGVWTARTALRLGEQPLLCASTGGESGSVLESLVAREGLLFRPVRVASPTASYLFDRRSGERATLAMTPPSQLNRHEVDDLYEAVLASAAETRMLILTGTPQSTPLASSFHRRLGADLASIGVRVVGDLHGPELASFLQAGRIELLKVSDEDLADDGVDVSSREAIFAAMEDLSRRGVDKIVVSRGSRPALAIMNQQRFVAITPEVSASDYRGSGDAMTGAFAVALLRGLGPESLIALGCGAGAASATRRGLATAGAPLIVEFAQLTEVHPLEPGTVRLSIDQED